MNELERFPPAHEDADFEILDDEESESALVVAASWVLLIVALLALLIYRFGSNDDDYWSRSPRRSGRGGDAD